MVAWRCCTAGARSAASGRAQAMRSLRHGCGVSATSAALLTRLAVDTIVCGRARPLRRPTHVSAPSIPLASDGVVSTPLAARLRGALVNSVMLCTSLGLAYLVGEVSVRILAPQQLIVKRPDVTTTINTGERTVHVFTDGDGFRVGRAGRVESKRRVLLLGDSFMEALQVEYEQSLAGLLEARLGTRLGETVAVRNSGVGGWDPPQYLMEARRELARERFDVVLVSVYLGNDVVTRRVERYAPGPPVDAPFHGQIGR